MTDRLPGFDVPTVQVQTHYVRQQFLCIDPPDDPDIVDPVTNVDLEEWMPVATNASREYQEALALVLELYHSDRETQHRVWIETRIR